MSNNKQRIFKILDIDFKNGFAITVLVDKEKVLKISIDNKLDICPNCKTELEQEGNQWFNKINIYICPKCKKQWI